jgi:hypothetical protein
MTNREITTLMHRLFRSDLGPGEYVHLMVDGQLDRARVDELLARHIPGDELLIFVDRNHCAFSTREKAFEHIREFMPHGRVRIADPRFQGRAIIEPLGVGAGSAL